MSVRPEQDELTRRESARRNAEVESRRDKFKPRRIVISDPVEIRTIIRHRRHFGVDRFDEIWNGTYFVSPGPDNLHQLLVMKLLAAIGSSLGELPGLEILPGINVSDRSDDWTKNYRSPDVSIFFPGNPAEDRETHWLGGPDVAFEIISPKDRARKKLPFYAKVGVRELFLIDRKPWRLELYRLNEGTLAPAGISDLEQTAPITSSLLNLSFRLIDDKPRPKIEITCPADGRSWRA
jgi:Uma2 family endonuclease